MPALFDAGLPFVSSGAAAVAGLLRRQGSQLRFCSETPPAAAAAARCVAVSCLCGFCGRSGSRLEDRKQQQRRKTMHPLIGGRAGCAVGGPHLCMQELAVYWLRLPTSYLLRLLLRLVAGLPTRCLLAALPMLSSTSLKLIASKLHP